jgi:hypothetical protein
LLCIGIRNYIAPAKPPFSPHHEGFAPGKPPAILLDNKALTYVNQFQAMQIRTRFYYHNKGRYFEYGGLMTIRNRIMVRLGDLPVEEGGRAFYFDDTFHTLTYQHQDKTATVDANCIITESRYKKDQNEYLVRLNWIQQQKLKWMFRRHWMQQPGNMVHLFILGAIVTLAFVGFELLQHPF